MGKVQCKSKCSDKNDSGTCTPEVAISAEWLCVNVDFEKLPNGPANEILKKELQHIFGNDVEDVLILGNQLAEDCFESCVESYVFIKVKNYFEHVEKLQDSQIIVGVLDTIDNPSFLTDKEVSGFKKTVKEKYCILEEFISGDLVKIREGYLKSLKGVVVKPVAGKKCKILFKLYTKQFTHSVNVKNLVKEGNLHDLISNRRKIIGVVQ